MKEYKLGENTILVVKVPEGAYDFGWIADTFTCKLPGQKPGTNKWLVEADEYMQKIVGAWECLGRASSITEQQAKGLVEEIINGFYKDYDESNIWDLSGFEGKDTALQSFSSWLTANGIDRESVLLKKER